MNRLYFCALYKYLCEKRYNASYVHVEPEHYWDPYTLIRFRRLDPKPADPDNPDIQTLVVYLSHNQGLCIIDPKAMEMLMLHERLYYMSYADPDWVEQSMGFKKSEMLKELDKDGPLFSRYFDIKSNIEFELGRNDYNCSRAEQRDKLISDYVKDIEKDIDIWPPYLIGEMMDDSGERMKKEAMLNGRYLFSIGLIQVLSVMAVELDKRYLPTVIGQTDGIKAFFSTFADEFEVYWGRMWTCSGTYNPASMWLTCFDNGLIRIDMPHTRQQTDILQLDPRTFVRLPYPMIYNDEEAKYLPTDRWYDVLKLKINEYLMMASINNLYNRKEDSNE